MYCDGAMVVKCNKGKATSKIKEKDIIIEADGNDINNTEDLVEALDRCKDNSIRIKFMRNQKEVSETVSLYRDENGENKLGVWVKDSAAGIGTVSFYTNENMSFSGLGHGICESETGAIIPVLSGTAESAYITSVTPNARGNIGCLNGYFTGKAIGEIKENSEMGIYGTLFNRQDTKDAIKIADKDEIIKGNAYILTTIKGDTPQRFDIEIKRINLSGNTQNLIIEITDPKLLETTGGIVQGMSGSPIIQNGKLVGAVTHVLVDDPAKGYGIFAENMLKQQEALSN